MSGVPSDILREQQFAESVRDANLTERQRVIDNMQPKSVEIQQYIEKTNNPNPSVVVFVVLAIILVLWLLHVMFVKKSLSGLWVYDNTEFLINHNKFDNTIVISIPKKPNFIVQSLKLRNGSFMLSVAGEADMYFLYNDDLDCFYVLKYHDDSSPTNEEDKKQSTVLRVVATTEAKVAVAQAVAAQAVAAPVVVQASNSKVKLNGLWKQDNGSDGFLMKYDKTTDMIEIYDRSGKKQSLSAKLEGNSFTKTFGSTTIVYTFNDTFDKLTTYYNNTPSATYSAA